MSILKWEIK